MLDSPLFDSPLHQMALSIWLEDNGHVKPGTPIGKLIPGKPPKGPCVEYEFPEVPVTVRVYQNLTVEEVQEP